MLKRLLAVTGIHVVALGILLTVLQSHAAVVGMLLAIFGMLVAG